MNWLRRAAALALPTAIALWGAQCGRDITGPTVTFVVVTPVNPVLTALGDTLRLAATARDARDSAISGVTFTWSSSDTGVATVSSTGVVTAVRNGTVTVTATSARVSFSTTVTVDAVASVVVAPADPMLKSLGATLQMTATARDARDSVISGVAFTWSSSNPGVATVSSTGLVTSVADGKASVRATGARVSSSTTVTVVVVASVVVVPTNPTLTALGDTLLLTATAHDARDSVISGATFTWASSDTTRVTVSDSGLVTAVANGAATVKATAAGVSGSTSVTVSQATATVKVTPANPTVLALGATLRLTGTARDARDSVISGATFTWSSSDPGVATVGTTGLVTAVTNGSATITATVPGGVSGGTTVTVKQLISGPEARLSAGGLHTCGLTTAGAAYCWGYNNAGQLGDGTWTDRSSPVAVVTDLTFLALSAGTYHTCGLTATGVAYCWGFNNAGQLGDGTLFGLQLSPVAVAGGLTFKALSAGDEHTCGLTTAGAAYCWGSNYSGQLGDGTRSDRSSPVAVVGGLTFQALTAADEHTCGIATGGAAYCWGSAVTSTPVAVAGGLTFQALTAGGSGGSHPHTCGLTKAGAAYCWGSNYFGQLGDGTTTDRASPWPVAGYLTYEALTAGNEHTCSLTTTGAAYCWGDDPDGLLGSAAIGRCAVTTDLLGTHFEPCTTTPVAVTGGLTFLALSTGHGHTCGLTADGAAYCWGGNGVGQLGDGTTNDRSTPGAVAGGLVFGAPAFTQSPAARRER